MESLEELLASLDKRLLLSTKLDFSSSSSTFGNEFHSLLGLGVRVESEHDRL